MLPDQSLGRGRCGNSGCLRAKGCAVLPLGAQKRGCVRLGVLLVDYARLAEHFGYGFVRRAGRVVQVTVSSDRLLKEPGDMLDVS
jgi:hypothetical protein